VLNQVREPHASYPAVEDRGAEKDDFAVITYEATIGGKPLKEEIPTAPPILQGRANFWVQINEQSFLPAFTDALTGLKPGEKKTVTVPLPADYSVVELQGKTLDFHVTLEDLHLRELPEWDDELAGQIAPGKTLEEVRTLVRENLERAAKERFEANKRSEIIRILTSQITCPLPRRMLAQETTAILRDVIQENQSRGVSEEELREHTESLVGMARESAEQRVRSRFLLLRLAEKEKLQVHDQEVISHLVEISARHNIAPKKLIKDMQKRNALSQVRDDILARKALEFLAGKAVVQSAAA
jgi:trigger factor